MEKSSLTLLIKTKKIEMFCCQVISNPDIPKMPVSPMDVSPSPGEQGKLVRPILILMIA